MSKEEAIKYLQQLYPNGGHCWLDEQRMEAIGMAVNALQEEPISEDLEEASKNYALNNTPWDDCKDEMQESFKAGAKWQKKTDESITNDLGEYLYELSKQFSEVSFAKLSRIGVRVAKWQKEQLRTVGDRTMSKAEKFISGHTRNCSNVFVNSQLGGTEENHPWLTPDQARRAVEIAREEMMEKACNFIADKLFFKDGIVYTNIKSKIVEDLKRAMKDE